MEREQLESTLNQLLNGSSSINDVVDLLLQSQGEIGVSAREGSPPSSSQIAQTAEACVDLGRAERCGFPEVVYGRGKTPEAIVGVFEALTAAGQACFATLVNDEQVDAVRERFPNVVFNKSAKTLRISPENEKPKGRVAVVSDPENVVRILAYSAGCRSSAVVGPRLLLRLALVVVLQEGSTGALECFPGLD